MKSKITRLLVLVPILIGYSAEGQSSKTQTNYYYGEVKTTSPDGKIPYGPVKHSLVKRTIDKKNRTITELVSQEGKEFNTRLSQVKNSNVFEAEDLSSKTFGGTITFAGKSWNWSTWTYSISMNDGSGKIIGEGSLTPAAIETKKYFVLPDGTKRVFLVEVLKKITAEEYLKLKTPTQ
jgi:hypothetical protein